MARDDADADGYRGLIRRLAGESAVYGFGSVANQAASVLLVPIYAHTLGIRGYGYFAVLTTTLALASTLSGFALAQAFFRSYIRDAEGAHERHRVLAITMTLRVALGAIIAGLYLAAAPLVAPVLIDDPQLRIAVYLLVPTIFADTIVQGPLQWLRAERRPRPFTVLSFGRAVGAAALAIVAVVVLRAGLPGVMVAMAVASVAAASAGILVMARAGALSFAWDGPLARSTLAFSLPLIPAGLAVWTLNVSDRYVINGFLGPTAVGVYALGYTIGMAINVIVVQPFTLAWSAAKWDVARDPAAPGHFARLTRSFAVVGAFAALGLSAFGIDVIRLLLPSGTEAARVIVPFSAFGYVLYGIYSIAATGLMLTNRPRQLLLTMSLAGAANVVLNLALIPVIGIIGAGVSTLAGYGLLAASTALIAHRYHPLPWRWSDVLVPLGTGLALAAAAILGPDLLAWRVACVLAYPAAALAGGWVPAPIVGYILRLARRVV